MLKPQPIESEASRIRESLRDFGGEATTEELSRHLIDSGFWSEDQLAKVAVQWAQRRVSSALKESDTAGLPYAIPSASKGESGAAIWKQLDMCTFIDVEAQVQLLNRQEEAVREEKDRLIRYAVRRWNRVPAVIESRPEAAD